MSNGSQGAGRVPDEAFASTSRPDPSRDRHAAFPEDHEPASLPPSAWAPQAAPDPRQPTLPELASMLPEVAALIRGLATRRRARGRRRGGLNPAGLGIALVVALGLLVSANTSVQLPSPDTGFGQGSWHEEAVAGLELTPVASIDIAGIQSVDQPTHEIPSGPSIVRIEVVSDDPAADIVVTSDIGDAQLGAEPLPYAAELGLDERAEQLAVTAVARYGDGSIQCRVYADGLLVSVATGAGLVECVAEPAR